jgi:hypothetical protein
MSNLNPDVLVLDKGLNLQSAKITAPTGSVLDGLNYEQVDFQGQKRIEGYARYDGSVLPAIDEYHVITLTDPYAGATTDLVATDEGLLGVVVAVSSNVISVVVINQNIIPEVGDTVYRIVAGVNSNANVVTAVATGTDTAADADTHYNNLLTYTAVLRTRVEELPGAIIGLHWFRDRLYAVADVLTVSIDGDTPEIFPNDTLVSGGSTAKVLGSLTLADTRVVFLSSLNTTAWSVVAQNVTRNAISIGEIANGFQSFTVAQEVASFYESRSEAQVLEEDTPGTEDFGWRFVDQGWSVLFENGVSGFGTLPSLNQNISGLGIQGPTSTTGNNGRPLILLQKVSITNDVAQVSGWKSSQTPTTFLLDPDNLTSVDGDTIYADAYLSWDGTTGAVSAPGVTTSFLTEYPATNTVEVDI